MRGRNFGWKAFWVSNPEWTCLKLTLDYVAVTFSSLTWEECWQCPGICLTASVRVVKKGQVGTIQCVDMAAFCGWLGQVVDLDRPAVGDLGQRSVKAITNNESSHYTTISIVLLILSS